MSHDVDQGLAILASWMRSLDEIYGAMEINWPSESVWDPPLTPCRYRNLQTMEFLGEDPQRTSGCCRKCLPFMYGNVLKHLEVHTTFPGIQR